MIRTPTQPVRPVNGRAPVSIPKLGRINVDGPVQSRIILNGVEGWGKTTAGAYAPNPAILMAKGESGYKTLRRANRVPDVDAVDLSTWEETLAMVNELQSLPNETIVLDALGGFERLCHEHVCRRDFNNDWGEKGFTSFNKGYEVAVAEWIKLLEGLDRLFNAGKTILLLAHAKVQQFKNPVGPDFDRYVSDCHLKTWGVTHKWADAVLFAHYVTVTEQATKRDRAKGIGGTERQIRTQRSDAWDAKNRFGMNDPLEVPDDPTLVWETIHNAINPPAADSSAGDDVPNL